MQYTEKNVEPKWPNPGAISESGATVGGGAVFLGCQSSFALAQVELCYRP